MHPEQFNIENRVNLISLGGDGWAFVPLSLPPTGLELGYEFWDLFGRATAEIGKLQGLAIQQPNPDLVSGLLGDLDAVYSSRIEGTIASYEDMLLFSVDESVEKRVPDVLEVINHRNALRYGLQRLKELPLSLRLLKEVHARLLQGVDVRGGNRHPGHWRSGQVHIGRPGGSIAEATYVPPPVPEMIAALDSLERFANEATPLPALLRIAMAHYQFEAIHPFWDGNGRTGRLMITLMIHAMSILPHPLLYLSPYFERTKEEYYGSLLDVSLQGNWLRWLSYFLEAVIAQAHDAAERCERLVLLREQYVDALQGIRVIPATSLVDYLYLHPVFLSTQIGDDLGLTESTKDRILGLMVSAGILEQLPGRQRNRIFIARGLVDELNRR